MLLLPQLFSTGENEDRVIEVSTQSGEFVWEVQVSDMTFQLWISRYSDCQKRYTLYVNNI